MSEVRLVAMRLVEQEAGGRAWFSLAPANDVLALEAWDQGITEEEARALRESTTAPLHPDPAWTYARRKLRAAFNPEEETRVLG